MKLDPVKVMEVLGMIQQTKEKTQPTQQETNNSSQCSNQADITKVLGGFFEKIMEKELEGKSREVNTEDLNRFGRVEPDFKNQKEEELKTNVQKLLLTELKVTKVLKEDKTEELIEKYLENFTKRELATLLYVSRIN